MNHLSISCWILLAMTGCFCSESHVLTELRCHEGSDVIFENPCPDDDDLEFSIFKKFFDGDVIFRDGDLTDDEKYELSVDKRQVKLRTCQENDEGIYIWSCSRNKVLHYNLEIILEEDVTLVCFEGHHVSFENPCSLPEQFEECKFKKRFRQEFILLNGVLNDPRFELDDAKTRITLSECHKEDEATYVLKCSPCFAEKRFHLEVHEE